MAGSAAPDSICVLSPLPASPDPGALSFLGRPPQPVLQCSVPQWDFSHEQPWGWWALSIFMAWILPRKSVGAIIGHTSPLRRDCPFPEVPCLANYCLYILSVLKCFQVEGSIGYSILTRSRNLKMIILLWEIINIYNEWTSLRLPDTSGWLTFALFPSVLSREIELGQWKVGSHLNIGNSIRPIRTLYAA